MYVYRAQTCPELPKSVSGARPYDFGTESGTRKRSLTEGTRRAAARAAYAGLIRLMAFTCGLSVANMYYCQPLLAQMQHDFRVTMPAGLGYSYSDAGGLRAGHAAVRAAGRYLGAAAIDPAIADGGDSCAGRSVRCARFGLDGGGKSGDWPDERGSASRFCRLPRSLRVPKSGGGRWAACWAGCSSAFCWRAR